MPPGAEVSRGVREGDRHRRAVPYVTLIICEHVWNLRYSKKTTHSARHGPLYSGPRNWDNNTNIIIIIITTIHIISRSLHYLTAHKLELVHTHIHTSLKHIFQRMTNKSYGNNFVYFILKQSMIMPFWLFITYAYMAPVYWKTCKLFRRQSRLVRREIKTFHWHTVDIRNNIYQDSFRL